MPITSITPNPKLFQKSQSIREVVRANGANGKSKKTGLRGNEFAGLSNYILSEIDSSGDEDNKRNHLTESSFSNSHSDGNDSSEGSFVG